MRECVPIAFGERLAFLTHSRTSCHSPHLRLPTRIARSRGAVQSPGIFRPEPRGLERRGFKTARSINPSILESRRPAHPPPDLPLRTHRRVARWGKNRRTLAGFSLLLHRRRGLAFPRRSPFSTSRGRRARRSDAPLVARERGGSRAHTRGRSRRAPARGARAGAGGRAPRADPAREKKAPPPRVTSAGQDGVELARGRARPPRGR